MQLLLTSAAPSNIGQSGDTIVQTRFCVSPCAWVKLIFSVSRIKLVIFAQVPCSLRPTTRFARVILEQGAMSSSQKNDPAVFASPHDTLVCVLPSLLSPPPGSNLPTSTANPGFLNLASSQHLRLSHNLNSIDSTHPLVFSSSLSS